MATATEIINLILQVAPQGKQGATELKERLESLRTELRADVTAMDALDAVTISGNSAIQAKVRELRALQKQLAITGDAAERVTRSSRGFGQSMLQAGRAVQDFQAAGFMGIANNLEGIAASMGLGAGVAGAVTLLGVAWLTWGPQITSAFNKLLGYSEPTKLFADRIDELNSKIKDLEGKDVKVRADFAEIKKAKEEVERLTKAAEAMRAILSEQSEVERESGAAVRKAIVETPGGQETIAAIREQEQQLRTEAERKQVAAREQELQQARETEAKRKRQLDELDLTGDDTPMETLAAHKMQVEAAQRATAAAESRLHNAEKDLDTARRKADATITQVLEDAQKGQGLAQVEAQRRLAEAMEAQGPAGQEVAAQILANDPTMIAQRKAQEAARKQQEQAQREQERNQAELDRMAAEADRAQKEEDEDAERFNKEQEKERDAKAKQFAPIFDDALQQSILANEMAQAQGGGISDAAAAARLKADVAQRLRNAPGIGNPMQAEDVAGGIVAQAIEDFQERQFAVQQQTLLQQRQLLEMMSPMQQQIFILQQMLQANQGQMGRMNANQRTRQMFARVPGGG